MVIRLTIGSAAEPAPAPAAEGAETEAAQETTASNLEKEARGAVRRLTARLLPTLKYVWQTEVHTYAFSVACNAILAFFPFVVLLLTIIRRVFHSNAMYDVVIELMKMYLPSNQGFITKNLDIMAHAHRGTQIFSLIMLLVTSSGVFLPLEVALNQIWGFKKNRSYIGNQIISLSLAFASGVLALISIALTASNQVFLGTLFGRIGSRFWPVQTAIDFAEMLVMKFFAIVASIAIFFLIYWLLPNGKVRARAVLPAAILSGIVMEIAKYIYIRCLPLLDFQAVYGPFYVSVTLMFWAFVCGLLMLGGAYLSAAEREVT
jgi:YihY family inner membrane protein